MGVWDGSWHMIPLRSLWALGLGLIVGGLGLRRPYQWLAVPGVPRSVSLLLEYLIAPPPLTCAYGDRDTV